MAVLFRIDNDYSTNKAPRIPVCICIDTSKNIPSDKFDEFNFFLEMVAEHISENAELKAKVQLCVVSYNQNPSVITDFTAVEGATFSLPTIKEEREADLSAALQKCVELINARIKLYKTESISHYLPQLLILSSGVSTTDITDIAQRLTLAQLSNKLCVLPFQITENQNSLLEKLTDDGIVYTDVTDFQKIFNCLKSGLELLSTSSASAGKNLKSQAIGLNQFIKKEAK